MAITISLNITVDATDLTILGQQLAAIARGVALLQAPAEPAPLATPPAPPDRPSERLAAPSQPPPNTRLP